jgi:hypothetical protein
VVTKAMSRELALHPGILTHRLLEELRRHRALEGRALSLYLNIDPKRWGGTEAARIAAKNTILEARRQLESLDSLSPEARRNLQTDLERAADLAQAAVGKRGVSGLAIFADWAARTGLGVALRWPVRPRWFFEGQYVLWPLEQLLHLSERYCVCLTDRDDTRVFLVYMGQIEEVKDIMDEIPGRVRFPDPFKEREYMHRRMVYYHRHLERAAASLLELYWREPFAHLILGGLHEVLGQFQAHLHSYLRDRVIAWWDMPVHAPIHEVLERLLREEELVEGRHAEALWRRIEEAAPGLSARGPEEVFRSLWTGRVHALLLDPDLAVPGCRCRACGRLTLHDSSCPECGSILESVDDTFLQAVEDAIDQHALVRLWRRRPELAGAGGIACLNQY